MAKKTPRRAPAAKAKARPKAKARAVRAPRGAVSAIPEGFRTVTPHMILDDAAGAIDFYKKAFGAKEKLRMGGPDGKIAHAEIVVGDSIVMLSDEMPPMPGQPGVYKSPRSAGLNTAALFLYVDDVDAAFDRALKAGCTVRSALMDMFWGDRWGQVIDPFGHTWGMGTRKENLTPAQMKKRQAEFMAQMAQMAQAGGGA